MHYRLWMWTQRKCEANQYSYYIVFMFVVMYSKYICFTCWLQQQQHQQMCLMPSSTSVGSCRQCEARSELVQVHCKPWIGYALDDRRKLWPLHYMPHMQLVSTYVGRPLRVLCVTIPTSKRVCYDTNARRAVSRSSGFFESEHMRPLFNAHNSWANRSRAGPREALP